MVRRSCLQNAQLPLVLAMVASGCGTTGQASPPTGSDGGIAGAPDAPRDTVSDGAVEGPGASDAGITSCPVPGQSPCGGDCVDPLTDTAHCGTCGQACAAPTPYCTAGRCVACGTGMLACGGACVGSDATNCGACGTVCVAPRGACMAGACVVPPPSCPTVSEAGCGWVTLPAGTFTLGGDALADNDMPSAGAMTVSGFTVDTHEVTVARFRRFWAAGHPAARSPVAYPGGSVTWTGGGVTAPSAVAGHCTWTDDAGALEAHPITCTDWFTAQAFCVWDGGRLPTEAEWEYTARGSTLGGLTAERDYPWSNAVPSTACDLAEWNTCAGDDSAFTRRVGSFATNGGLYDLSGNVWEWTADWYAVYGDAMCWSLAGQRNPVCINSATDNRVVRGGSWHDVHVTRLRSASRDFNTAVTRDNDIGFRCVRSP